MDDTSKPDYAYPRAYVGMLTSTDKNSGQRHRTGIGVWLSQYRGYYEPHRVDNLVQAANLIADEYQLCKLDDQFLAMNLGLVQLHPMLFDWLKTLLPGAPWDLTGQQCIAEPYIPAHWLDD